MSVPLTPATVTSRLFDELEQADFQRLGHAASLKGLLKPFKGKEQLIEFAANCQQSRDGLIQRSDRLLAQVTTYPFNLLAATLTRQSTAAGTAFLRWRNADRSEMGVELWVQLVEHPTTPLQLVHELFVLERERVALNMQISLTHTLARQARECAAKIARAEAAYLRRLQNHTATTKET